MARLTIWYPGARDPEVFEGFAKAVGSVAEVHSESPDAKCDIYIEGRPAEEDLKRVREGGAVVVPFAGVPPATAAVLQSRPDLTLHNLHHNSVETAETALALLLAASRRIVTADRAMRTGDWMPRYTPEECINLGGRTAMVLGMGGIGRRVAMALAGMGVNVIGVRRTAATGTQDLTFEPFSEQGQAKVRVEPIGRLREVLPEANFLIVTLPLTPETEGLIGAEELVLLKKPSIVVNIARGSIIKERDLFEALKSGALHAAGSDVWYRYPKHPEGIVPGYFNMPDEARTTYPSEFPFHELDNMVMSPHRGGSSFDAEVNRIEHLARLVFAFAETGAMPNRVDIEAGY